VDDGAGEPGRRGYPRCEPRKPKAGVQASLPPSTPLSAAAWANAIGVNLNAPGGRSSLGPVITPGRDGDRPAPYVERALLIAASTLRPRSSPAPLNSPERGPTPHTWRPCARERLNSRMQGSSAPPIRPPAGYNATNRNRVLSSTVRGTPQIRRVQTRGTERIGIGRVQRRLVQGRGCYCGIDEPAEIARFGVVTAVARFFY